MLTTTASILISLWCFPLSQNVTHAVLPTFMVNNQHTTPRGTAYRLSSLVILLLLQMQFPVVQWCWNQTDLSLSGQTFPWIVLQHPVTIGTEFHWCPRCRSSTRHLRHALPSSSDQRWLLPCPLQRQYFLQDFLSYKYGRTAPPPQLSLAPPSFNQTYWRPRHQDVSALLGIPIYRPEYKAIVLRRAYDAHHYVT